MVLDEILTMNTLKEFVVFQKNLLDAFKYAFPSVAECEFKGSFIVPEKAGTIKVKGDIWAFGKHGEGVEFERLRDGLIVDIDREFYKPDLFDTGRLIWYLESIHKCEVESHLMGLIFAKFLAENKIMKKPSFLYKLV